MNTASGKATPIRSSRRMVRARLVRRQRGLTLIETAVALGIVAIMLTSFGQITAENQQAVKSRAAAIQMQQATTAAAQYIQANSGTILPKIPVGGTVAFIPAGPETAVGTDGLESLQKQGYLSKNFSNVNPYGQQTALLVSQPVAGRIEAMVTTYGGRAISDGELGRIATSVGASGGYIPAKPVRGAAAGTITGAYGGWGSRASEWPAGVQTPAAGRIQSTLAFQNGALVQDFLYRHDIGIPEANTMFTKIYMGGNDVENAGRVSSATADVSGKLTAGSGTIGLIDMNGSSISGVAQINAANSQLALNGGLTATGNVKTTGGYLQIGPGLPSGVNEPGSGGKNPATAGSGYFQNDVTAGGTLVVNNDAQIGNDLSVNGDIVSKKNVVGRRFVDADAYNYSLDPNGLTGVAVLDASMLNVDAVIFGNTVKRGVPTNPKTLNCDRLVDPTCEAKVDALRDAYMVAVNQYDPALTAADKLAAVPIKLGDVLPRYIQKAMYQIVSDGTVIDISKNTVICSPPACVGIVPQPVCINSNPEIYLAKIDDSFSFGPLANKAEGIVGVTGSAQGPLGNYPMTGQTTQSVVTDIQIVQGVNIASNATVCTGNTPGCGNPDGTWQVVISRQGEVVNGVNGSTIGSIPRKAQAQTFCHFDF